MMLSSVQAAAAAQPLAGRVLTGVHTGPHGERAYRLYVPSAHAPDRARPLVVMLHGCTQDAADIARGTRLDAPAERDTLLVLYPEQPERANGKRCWNWYDRAHQSADAGEAALLAGMIREVARTHGADPARIYVAGISAGGAMAVILAATDPDLFAAAASHSGVAYGAAGDVMAALTAMAQGTAAAPALAVARERVVPLLVLHGDADPVVNARNGDALAAQWRAAAGLAGEPVTSDVTEGGRRARRLVSADAAGRTVVEQWRVEGLGHAWSGGSPEGTFTDAAGPDATAVMLRFFAAHAKSGRGAEGG